MAFVFEEESVEGLGLLKHITGSLTTMIRYLTVVAMSSFMIE